MAGCDMATIKQRHPLRDVFVAPYGCIGTVERSIEQRDFLNSCFTNLMHCNLLSVSTDASVERGVLLLRTLGVFHKFAQRWLHWRAFCGTAVDVASLHDSSSEFKGNSILGLLLHDTLDMSHWKAIGVFLEGSLVKGMNFTSQYEEASRAEPFGLQPRSHVQCALDAAISMHIKSCIQQVWNLTMEPSKDLEPIVSVLSFALILKTHCDGQFEDVYYHVVAGKGKDCSILIGHIWDLYQIEVASSRKIVQGFVGVQLRSTRAYETDGSKAFTPMAFELLGKRSRDKPISSIRFDRRKLASCRR